MLDFELFPAPAAPSYSLPSLCYLVTKCPDVLQRTGKFSLHIVVKSISSLLGVNEFLLSTLLAW